jgi:cobalamin synthase
VRCLIENFLQFFVFSIFICAFCVVFDLQLVRRLQGQDGDVVGEEVPTTPKKIFQIVNQVIFFIRLQNDD